MANEGELGRKRHAASMASAAESSKRRWTKRSSAEIHEDAEALNRNMRRNFEAPASARASAQMLQGNSNSASGLVERLQVEIFDLRRQQTIDRADFKAALNSHGQELEEIRSTLDGHHQGETPAEELLTRSESVESTVKSEEDDRGTNLYNAYVTFSFRHYTLY